MELIHHVALRVTDPIRAEFQRVGVYLGPGESSAGIVAFDISENDTRWSEVYALSQKLKIAIDMVFTKFTSKELYAADHLQMNAAWQNGYPQPTDNFKFLNLTYDLRDYCNKCGAGARQIAPFRIKKPPTWGKRAFFGLNWVFDEFFTKPEVWREYFEPFGIGCHEVLLHKNDKVIDSVVQLDITHIVDFDVNGPPLEICEKCLVRKYHPGIVGFVPKPHSTPFLAFRSSHYHGSGHEARRLVVLNQKVFEKIYRNRLKGVEFSACVK